jgi:hypothetical protein
MSIPKQKIFNALYFIKYLNIKNQRKERDKMKYEAPKAKIVDFKGEYVMAKHTNTECGWEETSFREDLENFWNGITNRQP